MDRRDQKKLTQHVGRLVVETPIEPVVQYLIEKGALTSELAVDILFQNTEKIKVLQLIHTLSRRGPHAFRIFVDALRTFDCEELARVLECN